MPISRLTKIGIARESNWGISTPPTVLFPIDPGSTLTEPYEQILDQLTRGINAMDFGAYQGVGHVEVSLSGHAFPEQIGYLMLAMMGDVDSGVVGPPYDHTFNLALDPAQPPSLSIQDEGAVYAAGASKRRYTGCLPSSLVLSFSAAEGLLTFSSDLTGQKGSAPGTGNIPAEVPTTAFRGWEATLAIGGPPNTRLVDAEIRLEREVEPRYRANNTQFPAIIYSGGLAVTASLTFDAESNTELDYVLGHATNKLVITLAHGTGDDAKEIELTMNAFNWGEGPAELDRSGVAITLGVAGRALVNATDAGPCVIKLKNAHETYTV